MNRPLRPIDVLLAVCRVYGVDMADVTMRSRRMRLVEARRVYGRLCREMTSASYPEIAATLGKPHHSSAMTWCRGFDKGEYAEQAGLVREMLAPKGMAMNNASARDDIERCLVCLRPATTLDSEGDPSCVYCKRVEDAHEMDWEQYDTTEADAARKWNWRQSVQRRKAKFEQEAA